METGRTGSIQGRFPFWFRLSLVVGLALRLYLAIFTQGTYDVNIWQDHAHGISQLGLMGYYHENPLMNHPPFISVAIMGLAWASHVSGLSFSFLLRLPTVLADAGSLLLLLQLARQGRYWLSITSLYWLNPLAIIYSGYHGNTDSLVAFTVLLSLFFLVRGWVAWAAVALGMSLWIKLPGLLVAPAFVLFVPTWRQRVRFLGILGTVAVSTYLPALITDPAIVWGNVFAYKGQLIQTTAKQFIWGIRIFLKYYFDRLTPQHQEAVLPGILFYLNRDSLICVILILILTCIRWRKRTASGLALTVTGIYAIIYAFSNHWAFQYLAWSIPFWCLADIWFAATATLFATAYIWPLYAYLCGNPWLLGKWDFLGHPFWPTWLLEMRDGALLFFISTAGAFLIWPAVEHGIQLWCRRAGEVNDKSSAAENSLNRQATASTKPGPKRE